jgi:hypothetical protein
MGTSKNRSQRGNPVFNPLNSRDSSIFWNGESDVIRGALMSCDYVNEHETLALLDDGRAPESNVV